MAGKGSKLGLVQDFESALWYAGALSDTWVSTGELLSGASYILTGCLFFKHFSLPHCHVTGVHPRRTTVRAIALVLDHAIYFI